jgi:hypothetical protein
MNALAKPMPATPIALLRDLDTWMANTGHDQEHPWRASILETLQAYSVTADCSRAAAPVVPPAAPLDANALLGDMSEVMDEVSNALMNARAMALAMGALVDQIDPCGPVETAPYGYALEACIAQLDQQAREALTKTDPLRAFFRGVANV